ncbi:MAG TPA: prepilin-type N-terminal cleavage/methylation domain-containing protein [Chthoniobacterales bacterium]|nr:prepilin-type N-terminal cleavage/methylation domain-containing protein [Chthoniobacterales bacterium]
MKIAGNRADAVRAFSLAEVMIAATLFSLIMAAVYGSTTGLINSMTASENYSVTQLQAMDYLSLDLRRATGFSFTNSGTTLTLPLDLTLPTFYESDGRKVRVPQRTLVTTSNKKDKKKHKVFNARYYFHYGTLGATVAVRYYLQNGNLYRKEGSLPARIVGTGVAGVTFGPDATAIAADPVVTATMTFTATKRAKAVPPPLSGTTFMRQYYYSDYN